MKRLLLSVLLVLTVPAAVLAVTKLPLKYRAVYCYPTGSYWVKQITAFPDYYAANNAFYVHAYGAATQYCPV